MVIFYDCMHDYINEGIQLINVQLHIQQKYRTQQVITVKFSNDIITIYCNHFIRAACIHAVSQESFLPLLFGKRVVLYPTLSFGTL